MEMGDETTPGDESPVEKPKFDQKFFLALAADQEFFLALAAKGKDEWNKWRRDPANKRVRVTFEGIDFSQAPRDQINFEGFEFGDGANFSLCKWRGVVWAEIANDPKAFRPGRANFIRSNFGIGATFNGAAFGDFSNFECTTFGDYASFNASVFGVWADFDDLRRLCLL
jgi:uncharacterized protein YjbI with pentapeptide repeats